MKRILAAGSIAALTVVGFAGSASAAPEPADAACFGQVHKTVNSGGVAGFDNVGQLVQFAKASPDAKNGGQGKNAIAKTLC